MFDNLLKQLCNSSRDNVTQIFESVKLASESMQTMMQKMVEMQQQQQQQQQQIFQQMQQQMQQLQPHTQPHTQSYMQPHMQLQPQHPYYYYVHHNLGMNQQPVPVPGPEQQVTTPPQLSLVPPPMPTAARDVSANSSPSGESPSANSDKPNQLMSPGVSKNFVKGQAKRHSPGASFVTSNVSC